MEQGKRSYEKKASGKGEGNLLSSLLHYMSMYMSVVVVESLLFVSEYEEDLGWPSRRVGRFEVIRGRHGALRSLLALLCHYPSASYHSTPIFIHPGFSLYAAAITNAFRQTNWSWEQGAVSSPSLLHPFLQHPGNEILCRFYNLNHYFSISSPFFYSFTFFKSIIDI